MSPEDKRLVHDVVQLSKAGMKRRAIARALRMSRNTVRRILTEHEQAREQPHTALPARRSTNRPSKLDPFRKDIDGLLETYPDITAQRVYEILSGEKGYDGGYTMVKVLVRKLRPKPPPTPSLQTPPRIPGQMGECDWSPFPVTFTDASPATLQAFGYTLRYSTRKFYRFFGSNGLHPLMDGHVHAFERFGGAPRRCTYDSQKPVVLRWEGNQPILNPRFIDFATHYEFEVVAVRHAPNRKPRVERSFYELLLSFFKGRGFRDVADLQAQLVVWMDTIADQRPLKRMKRRTRMELFAEEQPLLRPLPRHPYDTARVLYKLCDIAGYVTWETNRYSTPYEYVTEILPVRITESELFIYKSDLTCIARHPLLPRGAELTSDLPGHRPQGAQRGPDLDQLRYTFQDLGDVGAEYLAALEKRLARSAGYHARKVLMLREGWNTADLLKAISHAISFGVLEHDSVERILSARSDRRRLDEYIAEGTAKKLMGVVDQSCTEPRDLADYDALPVYPPPSPKESAPCPSDAPPTSKDQPPRSANASTSTSSDSA